METRLLKVHGKMERDEGIEGQKPRLRCQILRRLVRSRKLFRTRAIVRPAFRGELFAHQKTPYGFVRIQIMARFPDLLLDFVLFAPWPGVAPALHAVRNHLRALLAAIVGLDLWLHAAFLMSRQLGLRWLLGAAIDLRPCLRTRSEEHTSELQSPMYLV